MRIHPYHTSCSEYGRHDREVHHDHEDCPEGSKIGPKHREPGAGGKKRCMVCVALGFARTGRSVPPPPAATG